MSNINITYWAERLSEATRLAERAEKKNNDNPTTDATLDALVSIALSLTIIADITIEGTSLSAQGKEVRR